MDEEGLDAAVTDIAPIACASGTRLCAASSWMWGCGEHAHAEADGCAHADAHPDTEADGHACPTTARSGCCAH